MATGVESTRADLVISRLFRMVEQRGDEFRTRARDRNPLVRDGITHELMHVSKEVARRRGLRYWKSPESAYNTLSQILSGVSTGMSLWVANLLEATMDELDGVNGSGQPPAEVVRNAKTDRRTGAPSISLEEAETLILEVLNGDWTLRADLNSTLVPETMSQHRFEEALSSLTKAGRIERERERKKQGGMFYRAATGETAPPLPGTKPTKAAAKSEPVTEPVAEAEKPYLNTSQTAELILHALEADWMMRSDVQNIVANGASASGFTITKRTFERAMEKLATSGKIERQRIKGSNFSRVRLVTEPFPDGALDVTPELPLDEEDDEQRPRSIREAIVGTSIADRYFDILAKKLEDSNGVTDWAAMEPILIRLDKLAGISIE